MISRLYGWSMKRRSASSRSTSSRTKGWPAEAMSRIRSSTFIRSSGVSDRGSSKS